MTSARHSIPSTDRRAQQGSNMSDATPSPQRFTVQTVGRSAIVTDGQAGLRHEAQTGAGEPRSRSPDELATVLTELSSTISRLESIATRHSQEPDLQARLRRVGSLIESIGHDLLTDDFAHELDNQATGPDST